MSLFRVRPKVDDVVIRNDISAPPAQPRPPPSKPENKLQEQLQFVRGEQGLRGPRGERGEQGERGFTGEKGEKGEKGSTHLFVHASFRIGTTPKRLFVFPYAKSELLTSCRVYTTGTCKLEFYCSELEKTLGTVRAENGYTEMELTNLYKPDRNCGIQVFGMTENDECEILSVVLIF